MKRLKHMKNCLSDLVACQMADLKNANAHELGLAIDMIKDLSEAIYYCTITEAMNAEKHHEEEHRMYYPKDKKKMKEHHEEEPYEYPMYEDMRDPREGRSYVSRRMYMEAKDMGHDKLASIQSLEHYMTELTEDIVEMIENSSPEEKQLLQKKLNMLAQKVING